MTKIKYELKFLPIVYLELINRVEKQPKQHISTLDWELDQHIGSPHEGGCPVCFSGKPCLTAAYLSFRILDANKKLQEEPSSNKEN